MRKAAIVALLCRISAEIPFMPGCIECMNGNHGYHGDHEHYVFTKDFLSPKNGIVVGISNGDPLETNPNANDVDNARQRVIDQADKAKKQANDQREELLKNRIEESERLAHEYEHLADRLQRKDDDMYKADINGNILKKTPTPVVNVNPDGVPNPKQQADIANKVEMSTKETLGDLDQQKDMAQMDQVAKNGINPPYGNGNSQNNAADGTTNVKRTFPVNVTYGNIAPTQAKSNSSPESDGFAVGKKLSFFE
ncbi:hypothetical protein ENBRE01_2983 [Enteropsectra breve]|nr:hypothetical protein ENBRE01_2983 [Enteropsectra breve]